MPVIAAEIKFYLSGGSSNSDVNASLGGIVSSTEVTDATLHNLMDAVSTAEALTGDVDYRCIYVKNTNASITLTTAVAWIAANTPSLDSAIEIGIGTSALSGTEQTIANEGTAPSGVTFSSPSTLNSGLALGDMAAADTKAIWIRRTISAAAAAYNADGATISVGGDTIA